MERLQNLDYKLIKETLIPIMGSWVDAAHYVALFAVLLAGPVIIYLFTRVRKAPRLVPVLRRVMQVISMVLFVWLIHRCLCALRGGVEGAMQIGRNDIFAFGSLAVFIPLVGFTLIFGRVFCGWVCPLGFSQDVLGWIPRLRKRIFSGRMDKAISLVFWVIAASFSVYLLVLWMPKTFLFMEALPAVWGFAALVLSLVVVLVPKMDSKLRILRSVSAGLWLSVILLGIFTRNPWCVATGGETDYTSWTSLVTVSLAAMIVPMSWCRYVCPMGGLLGWFGAKALIRPRLTPRASPCFRCSEICASGALSAEGIRASECISCGNCVIHCPSSYGPPKATEKSSSYDMKVKIAALLVIVPLIGFLWSRSFADEQLVARMGKPEVGGYLAQLTTHPSRLDPPVGQWWTFGRTSSRASAVPVEFTAPLRLGFKMTPVEHVYSYQRGISVWSDSPVIGVVNNRTLIFAGYYDKNIYAFDANDGRKVWSRPLGGYPVHAPAFARVGGRDMLFVATGDRTLHALDAATGVRAWAFETEPWNDNLAPSIGSAPVVTWIGGRCAVVFSMYVVDKSPARPMRRGELVAVDAADGKIIWRKVLAPTPLTSPAVTPFGLVVVSDGGRAFGIDSETGAVAWERATSHKVSGGPSTLTVKGESAVVFGNWFGMLYCLGARDGRKIWTYKTGHQIEATPAFLPEENLVVVGAYDREIYGLDSDTGRLRWRAHTDNYISATAAFFRMDGRWVGCVPSLDNVLYLFDADSGKILKRLKTGKLLWEFFTRGDSRWSSPAVGHDSGGRSMLIYGSYDGALYKFVCGDSK